MPRYRVSDDGFCLNVERAGSGPHVVLLHGFTGSGEAWGEFASRLARRFTVLLVDLVGHGRSDKPREPYHYRMAVARQDVLAAVRAAGVTRAAWLGYSMGGRVALQIATSAPKAVTRLVLIGASPGIADPAERAARVAADESLATFIEREGVEAFVDRWERIPLFASQQRLPEEVRLRIRKGRLACDPGGLAGSLRGMGAGAQRPLHNRLAALPMPVLLIAGEEDAKYVALGQEMAAVIPEAEFATVPGAGHAAHVEAHGECARIVIRFLSKERSR